PAWSTSSPRADTARERPGGGTSAQPIPAGVRYPFRVPGFGYLPFLDGWGNEPVRCLRGRRSTGVTVSRGVPDGAIHRARAHGGRGRGGHRVPQLERDPSGRPSPGPVGPRPGGRVCVLVASRPPVRCRVV